MSQVFFARRRRRSERFAELLEEAASGRHRRIDDAGDLAQLVDLTRALTREHHALADRMAPDPDNAATLRAMLIRAAQRDGIGATARPESRALSRASIVDDTKVIHPVRSRGRRRARAALVAGILTGAVVLSGASLASDDALPGDPLYPVKRSSEQAQLALAGSDVSRARLHLELASVRLSEAQRAAPDQVAALLGDMADDVLRGTRLHTLDAVAHADAASLQALGSFVDWQLDRLGDLPPGLPNDAVTARSSTRDLLERVSDRASALEQSLTRGCALQRTDDLGPIPC